MDPVLLQLDDTTVGVLAGSGVVTSLVVSVLKRLIGEKLPTATIKAMAIVIALTLVTGLQTWADSDFTDTRTALTTAGAALVAWLSAHGYTNRCPARTSNSARRRSIVARLALQERDKREWAVYIPIGGNSYGTDRHGWTALGTGSLGSQG